MVTEYHSREKVSDLPAEEEEKLQKNNETNLREPWSNVDFLCEMKLF